MSRIRREAYEQLIWEDLDWLMQQPRSLERDHIALVLKASPGREYSSRDEVQTALRHLGEAFSSIELLAYAATRRACLEITRAKSALKRSLEATS